MPNSSCYSRSSRVQSGLSVHSRDLAAVADLAHRSSEGVTVTSSKAARRGSWRGTPNRPAARRGRGSRPPARRRAGRRTCPPTKLMPPTSAITSRKPVAAQRAVRRDDRRKKRGLGDAGRCRRGSVRSCCLNIGQSWPRSQTRKIAARRQDASAVKKARPGQGRQGQAAEGAGQGRRQGPARRACRKPWTPAEVEEAFRRFQAADAGAARASLQHVNPFTLLVAVVLSAQATDAGVNKATPALFALADTPEKMAALGEERVRD